MGGISCSQVCLVSAGFDWNISKLIITPADKLFKKLTEKECKHPYFSVQPRVRDDYSIYQECLKCGTIL